MLKRLKAIGATSITLIDLFNKQIRSVLEYAVPAWGPGISDQDSEDIERVQKTALGIIFGNNTSYNTILKKHKIDTLEKRRSDLIQKFASKTAKHDEFNKWYVKHPHIVQTRNKDKFLTVPTRHVRFENSPIPVMTRVLNN